MYYKHPTSMHAALGYAALGLRVIPLGRRRKRPWWRDWPNRGTTDPQMIVRWFERWPDDNIGILTGRGLIVIDIDPRNGGVESFEKLLGGRRLPLTAHARTGAGGEHYLFRVDPSLNIRNSNGVVLPGIDIKGEGGLFVAEPSVHPVTGCEYVWLRTPQQGISTAPSWLIRRLLREARKDTPRPQSPPPGDARDGDQAALAAEIIARFPVTGQGQRNDRMHRAVASLICRGYADDLILRVVMGWYDHFHDRGLIGTERAEAERLTKSCIASARRSPTLRPAIPEEGHRARIAEVVLDGERSLLIREGMVVGRRIEHSEKQREPPPPNTRVTHKGVTLCRTEKERAFVEALAVYFTYKVLHIRERVLKATFPQILQIIDERRGISLASAEVERLKQRYVTRPGKPASRFELVVQTRRGRQGAASEFRLTGLLHLMPPEAATALQERRPSPVVP